MIALYGFLEGDSLGLLILVEEADSVQRIAEKLIAAASVRVPAPKSYYVMMGNRVLDPRSTLADLRIVGLERIDVRRGGAP